MSAIATAETAIPVFPCQSLDATLEFYESLGFEVTYRQQRPYVYLAIRRGGFDLHFHGITPVRGEPKASSSMCLVLVDEVESYHHDFAAALRARLGRVPTSGIPRITRTRPGQSRFTLVDPNGNSIIFIRRDEPQVDYDSPKKLTGLPKAIATAAILCDMKEDDAAAAKTLDVALARYTNAPAADRARALAARVELAVALNDESRARSLAVELDLCLHKRKPT